jgi:hypothetical protein
MKITSDLTNLTTAILILTVQMFIEWTLVEILTNCQLKFLVSAYSNFFFFDLAVQAHRRCPK